MIFDATDVDRVRLAALHDVKYDVQLRFIEIHCFLPSDGELKEYLKANNCPSDLRLLQTWQTLHALLLEEEQTILCARAAAQQRWDAQTKSWAQWLTKFRQTLQTQATARQLRWQEAHQQQSQPQFQQRVRQLQQLPQLPLHLWQVLGLDPDTATTVEIKNAYRRLAMKHHPDRDGCVDRFLEIHQAYQLLMAARLTV